MVADEEGVEGDILTCVEEMTDTCAGCKKGVRWRMKAGVDDDRCVEENTMTTEGRQV